MTAENLVARSVLVVEDEPKTRKFAIRVLEEDGFVVTTAESSGAALKLIERENPQLVLIDISLPDISGMDIMKAVRANNPDTPVILITARAELREARTAITKGAFQYIQKPWTAEDLLAMCRRAAETLQLKIENRMLRAAKSNALPATSHRARLSSRPERAAMERAALVRVTQFMDDAISKTSTRVLEQALGEPASDVALTDVLAEVILKDAAGGEWAAALLRGAQIQRELLREAGGSLSASEVGDLLGIGRPAVDKRRRQGALLGLRLPSGDFVYPAIQFAKNNVLSGLPEVLNAFRIQDPWMQFDVLMAHDDALGGRTAFEALADGELERVKTVVASSGEQGL